MPCSTKLSSNKNAKWDLTLTPDKLDYNNNYCMEIRMGLRGRRAQAFFKIWVGGRGEKKTCDKISGSHYRKRLVVDTLK